MARYLDILRQYWGFDAFRGIQEKIIESIGAGHDTLGLMPTGGGKSVCFQVPALAMDGMCLVVTPLISLMKDQVARLRSLGIKAEAIYSGMFHDDILRVLDNCTYGNYKFLYVSPERLESEQFRLRLVQIPRICLITIDEAHCISQWGYDFRPSYMKIAALRSLIPYHVPVLALTATATPKVVDDIQDRLSFGKRNVFSMSFERANIAYIVRRTEDKTGEMLHILSSVTEGSAIVYTRSRKLTGEIARFLRDSGLTADSYHAGLTEAERSLRQTNWTKGRNRVMVATNAFGMGIDKPDVRLVIHYNLPDSVEAYFQEAGRAGRDGKKAYAVLLYNPHDRQILTRRVTDTYPDTDHIRKTYENICYFFQVGEGEGLGRTFNFSMDKFCTLFHQYPVQTESSLQLLNNAGYIRYKSENDKKSVVMFLVNKEDLYRLSNQEHDTDEVIRALLRSYSGLFADYVSIEETLLSHITGLTPDMIYNTLKALSHSHIIDYIPFSSSPTIEFTTPRAAPDRLVLSPDVYDKRKEEYAERIKHMLDYASGTTCCRSKALLKYFGEDSRHDCGQCDVCIGQRHISQDHVDSAREEIMALLEDRKFHQLTELSSIMISNRLIDAAIRYMTDEEEVIISGTRIKLK
ncbi:MAG: RecQ family ATP-dependent DNA helicase [Bacteroidaceae bacterium]|nr:RecQ family ATP-dependent DNA helicase [Bacteroidaceae bacterium]